MDLKGKTDNELKTLALRAVEGDWRKPGSIALNTPEQERREMLCKHFGLTGGALHRFLMLKAERDMGVV